MAKGTSKRLSKAQVKQFRALLEAKAAEIRASLQEAARNKPLTRGDEPLDLEELPGQSHEEWIFLNRNNIDTMLLREIDEALSCIEDGSYGTCLECGNAISPKRLQAVAWARYCVPCQEQLSTYTQDKPKEARLYS